MAEPFWATKFRGQPIRLELNDLSNQRLRAMKSHFGPDYGVPTEFIRLLLTGDMDAITGAIWIGQQKAGGPIDDLMALDFTLDDFEALEDPKPAGKKGAKGKEERPTKPSTTTDDSVETPSETETGTSSTSETSSD
jgi:hypothetical protein